MRILLIENGLNVSNRIRELIQESRFPVELDCRVECEADAAILEYAAPGGKSHGKEHSLRQLAERMPLVLICHREEQNQAIEALEQGASDYVCSDNLTRLIPVLKRVTKEAANLKQSEDRYRMLVEESPDGIGIYQEERLAFVNMTGVRQLRAKTKEELLGTRVEDIIHPDDRASANDRIARWLAGDARVYPAEVRYLRRDGTSVTVEVSAAPVHFAGKPAMQVISRDISERKVAEATLKESLLFRREAEKIARIGAWKVSPESDYLYWTEGVYEILEAPRSYQPGLQEGLRFYDEESVPVIGNALKTALADGSLFLIEARVTTMTGRHIWAEVRGLGRLEEDGEAYVMGTFQDITERKQQDTLKRLHLNTLELLASGATIKQVLESLVVQLECIHEGWIGSIMLVDDSGTHLRCAAGPRLPQFYQDAINEVPIEVGAGSCGTAAATKQTVIVEDICAHPYWTNYREIAQRAGIRASWSVPFATAQGKILGTLAVYHEHTCAPTAGELAAIKGVIDLAGIAVAKLRAEAALREREEIFSSIVGQATDAIAVVEGTTGRFVEFNTTAHEGLGYAREEFAGFGLGTIQAERSAEFIQQTLAVVRGDGGTNLERKHRHRNGSSRDVRISLRQLLIPGRDYVAAVWTDVTDQKRLESQLRQSQKIDAIGQLAGGVAHDFNNILAAMLMQIGLMQLGRNHAPEIATSLHDLEIEARRAASLTRQLLMFSRRSVLDVKPVDVNVVVADMLKMLRRVIGEHIQLRFDGQPLGLPRIAADAGMLEQVLMNLVVNARDAMPKGGNITIETGVEIFDEHENRRNLNRRHGRFVSLAVSDMGVGMSQETLGHIFEPFFTTKEPGKGTGLGLATVHGILAQHKGWVEVESELGKGTTFRVYFPVSANASAPMVTATPNSTIKRGQEIILLVEDESSVRQMVGRTLRALGYFVYEAKNGQEAMVLWQQHGGVVDLLLTDQVMPEGMTGFELAEQLQRLKPTLKVLISSGYSSELSQALGTKQAGIRYLAKPYETKMLADMVRACLE